MQQNTKVLAGIVAGVAALGISYSAGKSAADPVASPVQTVTATTTQSAQAVPQICLDALDEADKGFTHAGKAFDIVADTFDAIASGDWTKVSSLADKLGDQTTAIKALNYAKYAAECREQA